VVRAEPPARSLTAVARLPMTAGTLPSGSPATGGATAGPGWSRAIVACGAALAAHRRPFLRFNAGAHARADEGFLVQHFGTVFALGLALIGLFGLDTILRIRALEREHSNVREELSAASAQVFGEAIEDAEAVDGLLSSLDEDVVQEEIPARGALEVLELIAKVAAPRDGAPQAAAAAAAAPEAVAMLGQPPAGADAGAGGTGGTDEAVGGEPTLAAGPPSGGAPEAPGGPIPLEAGIVLSDALEFASIDIRAIKIELKVSATRAGAQDRLALQLEKIGCIRNITKGRIVDRNERKVFEMSMDHDCFTKALGSSGDTEGLGS
jgi:hypothetical protein